VLVLLLENIDTSTYIKMGDDEGNTSSSIEQHPAPAAGTDTDTDNSPSLERAETTESEKQEEFVTNVVLESDSTSPPEETAEGDAEETESGKGKEEPSTADQPSPLKPSSPTRSPRNQTGVTSSLSLDRNYVHDPNKIAIKFIFANRDGLNVYVKSFPTDSVHVLKQSLISLWPKGKPHRYRHFRHLIVINIPVHTHFK
jgi:hypothetical protein